MKYKYLFAVCWFLGFAPSAFPWGNESHQAIGEAAVPLLSDSASQKITTILGNTDLSALATWLDDVRNANKHHTGPLVHDPEAQMFSQAFPTNELWHFVDFPVGSEAYVPSSPFSSNDDVVHVLARAIAVLEGNGTEFTDKQALRIIVHLAGDIHQPLHCVSGYFDISDPNQPKLLPKVANPATAPQDRGGNQLLYGANFVTNMHHLWDTPIPKHIHTGDTSLAGKIDEDVTAASFLTLGDYHDWPGIWAGESMRAATKAYAPLTFVGPVVSHLDPNQPSGTAIDSIMISKPSNYVEEEVGPAEKQLDKAAAHLAQLLNSIHFK